MLARHRELQAKLIETHSRQAAERIVKLLGKKKPTVDEVAQVIAAEFKDFTA